eukprot:2194558-Rhodomonas_salina.2
MKIHEILGVREEGGLERLEFLVHLRDEKEGEAQVRSAICYACAMRCPSLLLALVLIPLSADSGFGGMRGAVLTVGLVVPGCLSKGWDLCGQGRRESQGGSHALWREPNQATRAQQTLHGSAGQLAVGHSLFCCARKGRSVACYAVPGTGVSSSDKRFGYTYARL